MGWSTTSGQLMALSSLTKQGKDTSITCAALDANTPCILMRATTFLSLQISQCPCWEEVEAFSLFLRVDRLIKLGMRLWRPPTTRPCTCGRAINGSPNSPLLGYRCSRKCSS